MQTVYLDVLLLINFFINWLLFRATSRLSAESPPKGRTLLGCLIGALYSLLLLIDIEWFFLLPIKLCMGISLLFLVYFRPHAWRRFAKTGVLFFFINVAFGGIILLFWTFLPPPGMLYKNGVVYFHVSALVLCLSCIAAYLLLTWGAFLLSRRTSPSEIRTLRLTLDGRMIELTALADTGNRLTDLFTGLPVILAEFASTVELLPPALRDFFSSADPAVFRIAQESACRISLRMIPVQTASGERPLPAFRPDITTVNGHRVQALVAVTPRSLSDGEYHAILPAAFC